MDRRRFLKVVGATGGGAAALAGCGIGPEPTEQLVPYLVPPENQVPGIATYYATTCRECAAGCGVHAKVREGRVIKLEGNPGSPINQGRLCARGQAALQGLYNPDRVTDPMARAANGDWQKLSWDDALARLQAKVREARGKGIAFVTGLERGSFGELVDTWTRQVGGRHVTYEPFAFEALRAGNRIAFGTSAVPWYDFANARYIVSFGADFMETWLSPVGYQLAFTRAHAFSGGRDASMAKFVYVGPRLALTGMNADQWIAAAPGTEGMLALAMAQVIVARRLAPLPPDVARVRAALDANAPERVAATIGIEAEVITRLAREFAASRGGLAVAGGIAAQYPNGAEIVAAVNILNYVAGQVGKTVKFGPNHALAAGGSFQDLTDLAADASASKVACTATCRCRRCALRSPATCRPSDGNPRPTSRCSSCFRPSRCTTAGARTSRGCRSCPTRSRRSPGTAGSRCTPRPRPNGRSRTATSCCSNRRTVRCGRPCGSRPVCAPTCWPSPPGRGTKR